MKRFRYILIIVILLSFVFAQPNDGGDYPPAHKVMGMMSLPNPQMHDGGQMNERMEMMMTWKLTNDLDLTPEHRENIIKIDNKLESVNENIRNKIDSGKEVTENEFQTVLEEFDSLEKQKVDERVRFVDEIGDILSNTQRAKLLMFKRYFMKDLRQEIRKRPSRGT